MGRLDPTEYVIGDAPQYFFDNGVVSAVADVTRTVHTPRKSPANPVIKADRPWEHITYFSFNGWQTWQDSDTGRTHCMYEDWWLDRDKLARGEGGTIHAWANARMRYLYAHSDDGEAWIKPPMGVLTEGGQDTNVVMGSEVDGSPHSMGLLRDPWETDESRRFKALYFHVPPSEEEVGGGIVRLGVSPDGIHWTPVDEPPVVGAERGRLDDTAIVAVDPESRSYLAITRHPFMVGAPEPLRLPPLGPTGGTPTFDVATDQPGGRNRRRVFMMESADFQHWTRPRLVLAPDPDIDNLDTSFYGMSLYRIGAQWLGFVGVFNMVSNTMHVELTHSRDGRTWRRVWPGRPWLEPGPAGAWDQFMVNVSSPPVAGDDGELRVYYGGSRNHHDWWFAGPPEQYAGSTAWDHLPEVNDMQHVGYALGLARMRRDGFVSLDAGREREGLIVTEPLVAAGDRLRINARCRPGGYLRIEVTDAQDRPLPGVTEADCDVFTGDALEHTVTWGGSPEVPHADGGIPDPRRPGVPYRRLRFSLRNAELYSFQFTTEDSDSAG